MCCVCKLPQSCPTLCNCMDRNLPDSSAHRIHQTRILKWVVISFSRGSSPPRDQTSCAVLSCSVMSDSLQFHGLSQRGSFSLWAITTLVSPLWKCERVAQSYLTLCDPMDCSPPDSSVHRIFQAGILKWVFISFSRELPHPWIAAGSPALHVHSLPTEPPGKPYHLYQLEKKTSGNWSPEAQG